MPLGYVDVGSPVAVIAAVTVVDVELMQEGMAKVEPTITRQLS